MEIKTNPYGQTVRDLAKVPSKSAEVVANPEDSTIAQTQKNQPVAVSASVSLTTQSNVRILQASMDANISAGNEPMALLFKTALEGINEALKGQLGDNAVQNAYASGTDFSPQATADRIVKMSTGFFEQYKANHADLSVEDALNSFSDLIGGGIDKGFKEARDILGGLKVLDQGNIASNIDDTYKLVQEGLKAFVENYKKSDSTSSDVSQAVQNPQA